MYILRCTIQNYNIFIFMRSNLNATKGARQSLMYWKVWQCLQKVQERMCEK